MSNDITLEQLAKFQPLNALAKESITQALNQLSLKQVSAQSFLFEKGSTDSNHYYLFKGTIELVGDSGVLKTISADSNDALQPLVQTIPRSVSAQAATDCTIISLDSDALDMLLTWEQSSVYQVQELTAGSEQDDDDWMMQLLRTEAFHRIPPANIQMIFMKMENINVRPGDKVINQGEDGDYFYIIKSGRCLVTRSTPSQPTGIKLAELTDGDTFGEEALISDSKRNATITMLTPGTLSRLSKADFLELLNEPSLTKIDFQSATELVNNDSAVWVDVRLPIEYKGGHINGGINIPLISLRLKIDSLAKDKQYIVYCDTERRSSAASFLLNEAGLETAVLTDGLNSVPEDCRSTS